MQDAAPSLPPAAAATARELRERFAFLPELIARMERRVPYASALVRFSDGVVLDLRDAEQNVRRVDPRAGVVLTVSNGYFLEEATSDRTDRDAVQRLAEELVERAAAYRPREEEPPLRLAITPELTADFATPVEQDPTGLDLATKIERAEQLRRRLRSLESRAVQAIATYQDPRQVQVFAHRDGLATQQLQRTALTLVVFVSDGQDQQMGFVIRGGGGGLEQIDISDEELAAAAEIAAALLNTKPVPPGTYDVVTDPSTSGVIAHEAFGHGVETDMFLKERARAAEYVGRRVGSDRVTIIDDPTLPGAYGSYFIDDEGQPAAPTVIIRDGIFERGLSDLYSASRLGISRSANGRRESVQRKAYARMSNTFFAPGDATREELLAGLDHGFELCRTINGMEDPKGWGMQIWAQYAREYRGGRPTGRLFAPVALTGYVPDVLSDVSAVADDFALDPGTCGKGWKELVPVTSGGPSLRTRCRLG